MNREADEIPDHEKVEAYEESQHSTTVRHQGAQGVGQLLGLRDDTWSVKHYLYIGCIWVFRIERLIRKLKSVRNYPQNNKKHYLPGIPCKCKI